MKYTKHITYKEWKRFSNVRKDVDGNFVAPGNDFQYTNYFTQKIESLQTVTGQEILLSKYKIILTNYEPKWTRYYHTITNIINFKNFDKGMASFDKAMQSFSKGMGNFDKELSKNTNNLNTLMGSKSKREDVPLYSKGEKFNLYGDEKPKKGKSIDDVLLGKKKKGFKL